LTADDIAKVDGIVADIIAGKIQVPSYIQTGACPAP
jgi:hypothetical protein